MDLVYCLPDASSGDASSDLILRKCERTKAEQVKTLVLKVDQAFLENRQD